MAGHAVAFLGPQWRAMFTHAVAEAVRGPKELVKIPPDSYGPLYSRHHSPSVVECPNGDLRATWFSCMMEIGTRRAAFALARRSGKKHRPGG